MANRRSNDVSRVETLIRRLGYLPDEPNRDRLNFSRLITLIRSTMSDDRRQVLIEKTIALEIELEETIIKAMQYGWMTEMSDLLRDLITASRHHRDEMMEML
jgi:hypothetical protein